ncbi:MULTISPECIES: nickel ABC transporter substrate-binding protein [Bacillales]|jgi:nickel transport system substrate-binding protein|uniref:Nickel ABC transporter substrate-binding protein n=1 Tax=Xylanibacillus composti TaxID=1572762 RepID=A0A8J4M1I9_9BACL|nr:MULTISPECIES: nickel ABC transporter substrate-binding protein [Bacillales]MBX0321348.1 nickel ABC transporter substrate-binding protein [Shouchella clausii]MDO7282639.1 nickel ABC transporter substrate-binding protein [Shouchella clausii]MDO7302736.1 nickel ABC transporter substrate-binding protein [Shouchella clausii]MDT9723654.1 nickel ABC transporter, nickel/metallophore periplasmic binding protein [Xylanibacillus composti]PAD18645.1 nickel ABC transporter, nickel/metallophore periplasm
MRKMIDALVVIALLLFVLTACLQTNTEQTEGEITLTESWDFAGGFYPIETLTVNANYGPQFYMVNFYETLVRYKDGEIIPGLAESWEISEDGLIYTFHLREQVKFSDGSPFNAEAVKRNLEVIPANLGPMNGGLGTVSTLLDQIVVIDTHTVEVHLTAPYYGALKDFTLMNPMAMVSPDAFNADGSPGDVLRTGTFGTGPYMYEGETDGTTYTFVKNPHYWGEEPEVERFHVKVIPDNDTKLLALRNGEVDILVGTRHMSYDRFNEMKKSGYGAQISEGIASNTRYLAFNVSKAPFDDRNVRLAASRAIDKEGVVQSIFTGIETKADSIFDPAMPYSNVELVPHAYDMDQAKLILEDAGWVDTDGDGVREKDGKRLAGEILYIKGDAMIDDLLLAISAQWNELGMDIKPKGMEKMTFHAEFAKADFDLAFYETYGSAWDPHTSMTNMKPDYRHGYPAAQALALVENGNEIIDALNVSTDEEQIQEIYDLVLNEINDQAILIPLSYTKELALYNSQRIAHYSFNGQPADIDVAAIQLK